MGNANSTPNSTLQRTEKSPTQGAGVVLRAEDLAVTVRNMSLASPWTEVRTDLPVTSSSTLASGSWRTGQSRFVEDLLESLRATDFKFTSPARPSASEGTPRKIPGRYESSNASRSVSDRCSMYISQWENSLPHDIPKSLQPGLGRVDASHNSLLE